MNLFDILGPVMVGPSSSHTAGAVRIGWMTQKLLGEQPVEAKILMYGSFAATGKGHGTDRGLVAGLLGMRPDDERIPDSFEIARKMGLSYSFGIANLTSAHPNSVVLEVKGKSGRTLEVQACSLGGGRIMINRLDGLDVNCSCEIPTLIVHNLDQPGHVAEVTYHALAQVRKHRHHAALPEPPRRLCRDGHRDRPGYPRRSAPVALASGRSYQGNVSECRAVRQAPS